MKPDIDLWKIWGHNATNVRKVCPHTLSGKFLGIADDLNLSRQGKRPQFLKALIRCSH
jgi:hypothetical protein